MDPVPKSVKIPVDNIPSISQIDCTTQLGVMHKLAEGRLSLIVYVTGEDVKQYWSQSILGP